MFFLIKNLFRGGVYHLIKLAHIFAGNHSLLPTPFTKNMKIHIFLINVKNFFTHVPKCRSTQHAICRPSCTGVLSDTKKLTCVCVCPASVLYFSLGILILYTVHYHHIRKREVYKYICIFLNFIIQSKLS